MSICIDIGNSSIKIAIFKKKELLSVHTFDTFLDTLSFIHSMDSHTLIYTNVTNKKFPDDEIKNKKVIQLNHTTPLPIINNYQTPKTLGYDRVSAVIGASKLSPHIHNLVIDMGSCMTYDLITKEKEYIGGGIAPSLKSRLDGLNKTTKGKLPKLIPYEINTIFGKTTQDAIMAGTFELMKNEIIEIIRICKKKFYPLQVFSCGGELFFFEKFLKQKEVIIEPNLVLLGLHHILEYQHL